ncbi:hypothetical protein SAMN05421823_107187 [Catalinimonas alkaloidigena]|uniref:SpoIIAA-like n=1 Tax=Catalinimonas alkaloidigena TaxID=1075417 RepID=A0A1G9LWW5_9BACT|nr:hypothetical protein [Catalinimonas alkaloidigena]SDL66207.1 hypothetical protein SAMN05421823_107187 [Catalinimonas alkaloidigena]
MKTIEQKVANLLTTNAQVIHDLALDCLSVTLNGFIPLKQLEAVCQHEFAMIQALGLKKCLVDLRGVKVYAPGSQDLIKDVWFPRVKEEGVQYIAFVVPEDVFGQASMNKAHAKSQQAGALQVEHFRTVADAKAWLLQMAVR